MPASFNQLFQSAGVDDDRKPNPGMIVPQVSTGSNYVRLVGGAGYQIEPSLGLKYEELPPPVTTIAEVILLVRGKPDLFAGSRVFRVWNDSAPPGRTATLSAFKPGARRGSGTRAEATVEVAILRERKIKLAIRPVQTRNPATGALDYHSKKTPIDTKALVADMNAIWTPQANVVFNLLASDPVTIDVPPIVDIIKFEKQLDSSKWPGADLTMFLVAQASDTKDPAAVRPHVVPGVTNPVLGFSLISDDRATIPELMAHEAGHFVGRDKSTKAGFPDLTGGDTTRLMYYISGAAAKIPYDHAVGYFNPP